MSVLKKTIASGHTDIGIFYGAAHMRDMSQRLEAMGFHKTATAWRIKLGYDRQCGHDQTRKPTGESSVGAASPRLRNAAEITNWLTATRSGAIGVTRP